LETPAEDPLEGATWSEAFGLDHLEGTIFRGHLVEESPEMTFWWRPFGLDPMESNLWMGHFLYGTVWMGLRRKEHLKGNPGGLRDGTALNVGHAIETLDGTSVKVTHLWNPLVGFKEVNQ
jgi:hypothetical protein